MDRNSSPAADPDGYTLLFGNASSLVVGPAVYRFRDYDTLKNFTPVAKVTEGNELLVVAPDLPIKTVMELVAYAKANPGRLNFGSMGYGNMTHLIGEMFKLQTGTDFTHIPYKGSPEAVAGLVSSQVQMLFGEVAGLLPTHARGRTPRARHIERGAQSARTGGADLNRRRTWPISSRSRSPAWSRPPGRLRRSSNKLNAAINTAVAEPDMIAASGQARRRGADRFGAGVRRLHRTRTRQVGRCGDNTGIKAE